MRAFVSPPLEPNKDYTYDVKAQWMQNGKQTEQTRHVRVHAGERAQVNFSANRATGRLTALPLKVKRCLRAPIAPLRTHEPTDGPKPRSGPARRPQLNQPQTNAPPPRI